MKRLIAYLCLLSSLAALPARADAITVFAAASLQGVLEKIAADLPEPVRFSFGGSGQMARQVASGAPADAVILAHPDWMDWLVQKGLLAGQDIRNVTANGLVLVGPSGTLPLDHPDSHSLAAALGDGRLAMGQRDAVPAGIYARQWLASIGAWDRLSTHLAETDNVRAALALVAQGATPLGIVYASDAVADPRVIVLYQIPADSHDPILYPAAALTPHGQVFLDALETDEARAIFAKHGFSPVRR